MQLTISPNIKISDIQHEFNKMFPYLKLEFFNNKTVFPSKFSAHHMLPPQQTVGESQRTIRKGTLEIEEDMKVQDLEKKFRDQFSLAVQVFRKSGPVWLETTMTDNWTLHQQNKHGSELSTEKQVPQHPEDYDLNRDSSH